jgi:UDP-N-acetylmuramoylalanine--D-glutamate ligase
MTTTTRASAPWFAGARALVVGVARSGSAAARLLLRHGASVRAIDRRRRDEIAGDAAELEGRGVEVRYGTMDSSALEGCDLVVTSPGVPADLPLFAEAARRGIPVAPELELGFAVARAPILAVTGTNGKSTTVELLGAIGRNAGKRTEVLGNIGTALSERAEDVPEDGWLVVEVSSFQLELCTRFRPHVGILLNVTPDHLDRHGSMERYAEIKTRLFAFQNEHDFRVQPLADSRLARLLAPMRSSPIWFGFTDPTGDGVWEEKGILRFRFQGREGTILRREEALLRGPHNTENICAAAGAALAADVSERVVAKTLKEFRGLPHRLTLVAEIEGVRYINDSKATNVDAMKRALESFTDPITLIAGGRDKDGDFEAIASLVHERVHHAVYVGEATSKLERAFSQVPSTRAKTLEEAVSVARSHATPGGVVLLSPGCASFDMFRNFEERGARFEAAVMELKRSIERGRR